MSNSLISERLQLREWIDEDQSEFAAISADPEVMRYYPKTLTREESDATLARIRAHFDEHGFGLWALEGRADIAAAEDNAPAGVLLGFAGLLVPRFEAHFTPCIEIGWRLARQYWSRGFATEAAHVATRYCFEELDRDTLFAMTVPANTRSRAVMERLGMTHDAAGDFDHPLLPGHELQRHVLYRLKRDDYRAMHDVRRPQA